MKVQVTSEVELPDNTPEELVDRVVTMMLADGQRIIALSRVKPEVDYGDVDERLRRLKR